MTKAEVLKEIKKREEQKMQKFTAFMLAEKFTETKDDMGNFSKNMPVFFKKLSENNFLIFNIPFYGKGKGKMFQTDFWKLSAKTEDEFLNQKVESKNLQLFYLDLI